MLRKQGNQESFHNTVSHKFQYTLLIIFGNLFLVNFFILFALNGMIWKKWYHHKNFGVLHKDTRRKQDKYREMRGNFGTVPRKFWEDPETDRKKLKSWHEIAIYLLILAIQKTALFVRTCADRDGGWRGRHRRDGENFCQVRKKKQKNCGHVRRPMIAG